MKKIIALLALSITSSSFAAPPSAVIAAAKAMKSASVRTVTTKVNNTDGNPCIPEGVSYNVELQVKQAAFNRETNKVVYTWETAKTINVSKSGEVSEVCAE
jgi:hypothetical protein